jgi:hypothetical protein
VKIYMLSFNVFDRQASFFVATNVVATYILFRYLNIFLVLSGTIIRGTLKTPKSQLVTPISTKLQRPDGCD